MEVPWSVVGPLIAVIIALIGWVYKLNSDVSEMKGNRAATCELHGKQLDLIPGMKADLEAMKARQETVDKVLAPHLASIIKSNPHNMDRNALVEKLVEGTITDREAMSLDYELSKMLEHEKDNDKKLAAALLLARVRWLLHDLNEECR